MISQSFLEKIDSVIPLNPFTGVPIQNDRKLNNPQPQGEGKDLFNNKTIPPKRMENNNPSHNVQNANYLLPVPSNSQNKNKPYPSDKSFQVNQPIDRKNVGFFESINPEKFRKL